MKPAERDPLMPLLDAAVANTSRVKGVWIRWRIRLAMRRERRA